MTATPAKHNCGGVVFGQKTPGCPRCDELLAGAEPRTQPWRRPIKRCVNYATCHGMVERGEYTGLCRSCQIKAHDCTASKCGPVCTAFQW